MNCEKCGAPTNQAKIKDVKNLSKGFQMLCTACIGQTNECRQEQGGLRMYATRVVDPVEVAQQINPDVSCDFCNCSDPQWLYDLKMGPLELNGRAVDLGTRWATCEMCARAVDENSPLITAMRQPQTSLIAYALGIHTLVMDHLSNKRSYVRSEEDGVIKPV